MPAPVPLALPHGSTFAFFRDEDVDWLRGATHIPMEGGEPMPADPEADGKCFVSLLALREAERLTYDTAPAKLAMRAAQRVLGFSLPPEPQPPAGLPDESYATVFEAVTPLLPVHVEGRVDIEQSTSAAFDRVVEHLAELHRAYVLRTDDFRVRVVSRRSLYPFIPWTTRTPDLQWGGLALFLANSGEHVWPRPVAVMAPDEMEALMAVVSRVKRGDPIAVWAEHARSARRAFLTLADYGTAAVGADTACEVLLDAVLLLTCWEEGLVPEAVAPWFNASLTARVRSKYSERLGGAWDTTNNESVMGRWSQDLRQLRHRVVHAGHAPSEREAGRALDSSSEVEDFVKARLAERRNRFPRTTLLVVGRPGLEQMGLYQGRIRRFVEEDEGGEEDWLASYRTWEEAFRASRQAL